MTLRDDVIHLNTIKKTMKNKTAIKYFLHTWDKDADGEPVCFFGNFKKKNWGFWVSSSGQVTIDSESSNGNLPSQRVVDACRRAAMAYLAR